MYTTPELTGMTYIIQALNYELPKNVSMHTQRLPHSQHILFHFSICPKMELRRNLVQYSCKRDKQNCHKYNCDQKIYSFSKKIPFHMLEKRHEERVIAMLLNYIDPIAEHTSNIPDHIPDKQINMYVEAKMKKYGQRP